MSNGNERNETGETTLTNFTEAAKVPQQHSNWSAKQAPEIAIGNWVNSCGRQDQMSIHEIVGACWMLEPVVEYLAGANEVKDWEATVVLAKEDVTTLRKQLIRSFIRQALMRYIDTVVIASVPTVEAKAHLNANS